MARVRFDPNEFFEALSQGILLATERRTRKKEKKEARQERALVRGVEAERFAKEFAQREKREARAEARFTESKSAATRREQSAIRRDIRQETQAGARFIASQSATRAERQAAQSRFETQQERLEGAQDFDDTNNVKRRTSQTLNNLAVNPNIDFQGFMLTDKALALEDTDPEQFKLLDQAANRRTFDIRTQEGLLQLASLRPGQKTEFLIPGEGEQAARVEKGTALEIFEKISKQKAESRRQEQLGFFGRIFEDLERGGQLQQQLPGPSGFSPAAVAPSTQAPSTFRAPPASQATQVVGNRIVPRPAGTQAVLP